jgi:hypothetical protein
VRKPLKWTFVALAIVVTAVIIGSAASNLFDNTDCQQYNYNNKLNGGVKIFNNKKYNVNVCGSGVNNSMISGDSMDVVQLTITDEPGNVLAKRRYKVFWEGQPGHAPLIIGNDSITYQDDEKQKDYTVTMPPTFLDRIRAKVIPF